MGWKDLIPWKTWETKRREVVAADEHPILGLRRDVDRLFDDVRRRLFEVAPFESAIGPFGSLELPKADVEEGKKKIEVTVEVPGLSEDDLELTLSNAGDALLVSGERRHESESEEDDKGPYRTERYYGLIQRTIPLPHPVVMDGAKARLKKGVLHVVLRKREEAADAKRITVTRG